MKPLDAILDRARANRPRIVLPEGEDPRIVAGAARAAADGLARPVLLGDAARIAALLAEAGFEPGSVETLDPAAAPQKGDYAAAYESLRRHKGVDAAAAARAMADPMTFAAMMVRAGDAEARSAARSPPPPTPSARRCRSSARRPGSAPSRASS
jgi:phosphate acetyltransferase